MSGNTPLGETGEYESYCFAVDANGSDIAYIHDRSEQNANSRLIVEAPAMLEALKAFAAKCLCRFDEYGKTKYSYCDSCENADAILARIEGMKA